MQEAPSRAVLRSPMQAPATKREIAPQSRRLSALWSSWIAALPLILSTQSARASEGPYAVLQRLSDVLVYIEQSYVDPIDRSRLLEGATVGMVAELDPHSAYLTPTQFSQFLEDTQGEFAGLGVEVDFREDRVTVIATMPNSPAEAAGLRSGDRIVAVDSIPITGVRAEAIIRKMRGAAGTKVRLTIRREGVPEPIQLTVTRAIVNVPSVEGKLLDGNVAYVRLKSFQEGSYVELVERVADLNRSKRVSGLLLDLRGNPGGLVSEAVAIADEFLDRGLIYSARHRGQVVETVESKSGGLLLNLPLIVLVGASTASSAEIVAGALQDRGRATIVGEPTFGKGSVQNVIELRGGAGLLLTTLRYFTPKGRAIQARGLIPDVIVKSSDARPALREADISGHLHTEGATPEYKSSRGEKRTESDQELSGQAEQNPTPPERAPLTTVPSNPVQGSDLVLARAYELLLGRIRQ